MQSFINHTLIAYAMGFEGTDQVKIGELEFLTEESARDYGDNVFQYFDRLANLDGQEMPYSKLENDHLKNFDAMDTPNDQKYDISFEPNPESSALLFKMIPLELLGPRHGHVMISESASEDYFASLPLEKIE